MYTEAWVNLETACEVPVIKYRKLCDSFKMSGTGLFRDGRQRVGGGLEVGRGWSSSSGGLEVGRGGVRVLSLSGFYGVAYFPFFVCAAARYSFCKMLPCIFLTPPSTCLSAQQLTILSKSSP